MILEPLNKNNMIKQIDFKMVLGALACIALGVGMIMGAIQNVIAFVDPLNELFTTVLLFMMAIGCTACIKK